MTESERHIEFAGIPDSPRNRTLESVMLGNTTLTETNFDIQFSGGRFLGIIRDNSHFLCGRPVQSYLTLNSDRIHFETQTAFSFGDMHSRGLRECLAFRDGMSYEECSILIDYLFVEGFPHLLIDIYVTFPVLEKGSLVSESAPFEIPLFMCSESESIKVMSYYPDGSSEITYLTADSGTDTLFGEFLIFIKGEKKFLIGFIENPARSIYPLPYKFEKTGDNYLLSLNPGGSYKKEESAGVSAFKEHFTLAMSPDPKVLHSPQDIQRDIARLPLELCRPWAY